MEKTTTIINVQNAANIKAEGKLHSRNCIPVICLETGEAFTSVTDAAAHVGVHQQNMSAHLTGKRKSIKGKHFCYMSRSMESMNVILEHLRANACNAEKARMWDEYQAKEERIRKEKEAEAKAERKAKEEYEAKEQKLAAKILRRRGVSDRMKQGWDEAIKRQMDAEREYEEFTGHAFGSKETA